MGIVNNMALYQNESENKRDGKASDKKVLVLAAVPKKFLILFIKQAMLKKQAE
jgi:hypothetical protein